MKSPGRFLALPAYVLTTYSVTSSQVGELYAPESTRLDIDDVFNGDSLCVLDYVMSAFDGGFDEPEHMMIVVKTGSILTPDGWVCDYEKKVKVIMLNDSEDKKDEPKNTAIQLVSDKREDEGILPLEVNNTDDLLTDFEEDDFGELSTSMWGESSKMEASSVWETSQMQKTYEILS